jgi:hypothetical protein
LVGGPMDIVFGDLPDIISKLTFTVSNENQVCCLVRSIGTVSQKREGVETSTVSVEAL